MTDFESTVESFEGRDQSVYAGCIPIVIGNVQGRRWEYGSSNRICLRESILGRVHGVKIQ